MHSGILPSMLEHGGGHLVVISSLQGKMGIPHRSSCKYFGHIMISYVCRTMTYKIHLEHVVVNIFGVCFIVPYHGEDY